jgi:predicted nucleotidyltransferase
MTQLFTFHQNYKLVKTLLLHGVRFLVVGGLAVKLYASEREVDDLDLLIEQTPKNADCLFNAFRELGLSWTSDFSKKLISYPNENKQLLVLKNHYYADLVTAGNELNFEKEWHEASEASLGEDEVKVRVASRNMLILQKRKASREKDLGDVLLLERTQ